MGFIVTVTGHSRIVFQQLLVVYIMEIENPENKKLGS